MYEIFELKTIEGQKTGLTGYRWEQEEASYVVCLIHGIGEYAGRYGRMAQKMGEAGINLLSMDLRGHGKSFGKRGHCAPRAEIRQDMDRLIAYAQERYPHIPVILYGHSMGGNLVLDYRKRGARNHVPAAYIVSAPWVELVRNVPRYQYQFLKALSKLTPSLTISSGVSAYQLGNQASVGSYEKDPLVHKRISLQCAVEGFDTGIAMAEGKLEDNGGAKGAPLLLMHGTEDKICNISGSRKIAAAENCQYVEWPGFYHEIHNGGAQSNGDEVIEKVIQWIQELSV